MSIFIDLVKISPSSMEPKGSLSCSQELGTGSYLKPDISNTQFHAPFPHLSVIPKTIMVRGMYRLVLPT